jgi:hypothetical protein
MFLSKYFSSSSFVFLKEAFTIFIKEKTMTPMGGANFYPRAFILTNLVDTH